MKIETRSVSKGLGDQAAPLTNVSGLEIAITMLETQVFITPG